MPGPRHMRYYWQDHATYRPWVYSALQQDESEILSNWFDETEQRGFVLETGVPLASLLVALVNGNNIRKVVQLGHHAGYSTLMLGFCLRSMAAVHGLWSVDIDPKMTEYTKGWINRAGLGQYVATHTDCSANPVNPGIAESFLGETPALIFIDSSHRYRHTLRELDVWYPAVQGGGLIVLHDASVFSASLDDTNSGGVCKAVSAWKSRHPEASVTTLNPQARTCGYMDICGVAIIQKPGCLPD